MSNNFETDALRSLVGSRYSADVDNIDIFGDSVQDTLNIEEEPEAEIEEEYEDDDDLDDFDQTKIHIPTSQALANPVIIKRKEKDEKCSNTTTLLDQVHRLVKLLDEHEIEISDKLRKMIANPNLDVIRLREIKTSLSDLYDTHTISTQLTDWIIQGSRMLCAFCNGENTIPFTPFKLNLTGYSTRLKKVSAQLNKENMEISRKINESVGKSSLTLFKWVSILGLPLLITIGQNHGSHAIADCDKHDDLDDDEDEEENEDEASSREVSDTSEYESEDE